MSTPPPDWDWVRQMLAVRSGARCEATGERDRPGLVWAVHHRRHRGMGGSDVDWLHDLGNLVLLTEAAHVAIHSYDAAARACGLSVDFAVAAPWDVPVTLWSGRRVMLAATDPLYLRPGPGTPAYGAPFTGGGDVA